MLGLSANLNYYLFNGNVDLRKGIFRLCESIIEEMSLDLGDASNVYMFMSRNRKVVKILHYERGFYVLYEKRPVMGKFKKLVFDEVSSCYWIQYDLPDGNEPMRKAVNYTINQWKSLRNILKDGSAEISNNLCEQRMKPVKLLLKDCMNIGSEGTAENSAFIFSLIESCKLNDIIDPQDYLKHLLECILRGKDCDRKALLSCFYKPEC